MITESDCQIMKQINDTELPLMKAQDHLSTLVDKL